MHQEQQPAGNQAMPQTGSSPTGMSGNGTAAMYSGVQPGAESECSSHSETTPPQQDTGGGMSQTGNAPSAGAGGPSDQAQGHAHLTEHITGIPSQVGMNAAGYVQQPAPGMPPQQPGPDMGQPHYSSQMPGAAPYQGAPLSNQAPNMGDMPGYGSQQPAGAQYAGQQQMPGAPQQGYPTQGGYPQQGGYPGAPQFPPQFAPQGQAQQYPSQYGPAVYGPTGYGPQTAPTYGAQQFPGMGSQQPGQFPGMEGLGQENRYGELYGLINEAANGNADVSKFMRFFQSTSSDFWKGALIGTGLTLLLTNDTVKETLAKGFAGVMGMFSQSAEDMEAEEDRKAEEHAAREAAK